MKIFAIAIASALCFFSNCVTTADVRAFNIKSKGKIAVNSKLKDTTTIISAPINSSPN